MMMLGIEPCKVYKMKMGNDEIQLWKEMEDLLEELRKSLPPVTIKPQSENKTEQSLRNKTEEAYERAMRGI